MEVTQYTYFQQVGGIEVDPVPVEITYGLERIAMYAQGVDSVYDLVWSYLPDGTPMTYGEVFLENEREFSAYNFEVANVEFTVHGESVDGPNKGPVFTEPHAKVSMKVAGPGMLIAASYCNIHGLWENAVELKVEA